MSRRSLGHRGSRLSTCGVGEARCNRFGQSDPGIQMRVSPKKMRVHRDLAGGAVGLRNGYEYSRIFVNKTNTNTGNTNSGEYEYELYSYSQHSRIKRIFALLHLAVHVPYVGLLSSSHARSTDAQCWYLGTQRIISENYLYLANCIITRSLN